MEMDGELKTQILNHGVWEGTDFHGENHLGLQIFLCCSFVIDFKTVIPE